MFKADAKPETAIVYSEIGDDWEVWYKGVMFAEFEKLEDAHNRLQALVSLDSTK